MECGNGDVAHVKRQGGDAQWQEARVQVVVAKLSKLAIAPGVDITRSCAYTQHADHNSNTIITLAAHQRARPPEIYC